jgi:prepilin-type N-terminal cleavage/methylation domain-containing protein
MKNFPKRYGFTLIELLVVISIIALLMAVLMPALSKARSQARKVVCGSNFHQVGIVHQLYANDYNQLMRFVVYRDDFDTPVGQPVRTIIPYLMPKRLFDHCKRSYGTEAKFWICPSFKAGNESQHWVNYDDANGVLPGWNLNSTEAPGQPLRCYYVAIANVTGIANLTNAVPRELEESALKPTDNGSKILAADLNIRWDGDWNNPYSVVAHPKADDGYRVPDGGNRVYLDGSVKWVDSDIMARDDRPIKANRSRGKFDHWKGGGSRDYYW